MEQQLTINIKPKKKNKPRKIVPNNLRCQGLKTDGERCSRSKLENEEFCKSHLNITNVVEVNKNCKKRGRKPKVIADKRIFDNEYIPVYYTIINGEKLLIDFDNNVYSNDLENPVYLGKNTIYGIRK